MERYCVWGGCLPLSVSKAAKEEGRKTYTLVKGNACVCVCVFVRQHVAR